jgi:4-aminobutyrate aminotransferase/(S)-3-amino-2-methylpropionate transaminase
MGAIQLRTELPGPKSRALLAERKKWVSAGISEPRHGLCFESASGARLTDLDGNVILDFSGGIGCMNAGHSAPRVIARAQEQLAKLQHTCFQVGPYESYVALARKLCELVPIAGAKKAAFFNSGAEAVENAVKIARKATGRPAVIAFESGFHGRTLLGMTLTTKILYKEGFGPFAPEVYRCPLPDPLRRPRGVSVEEVVSRGIDDFHRFLKSTVAPSSVACVILEPVMGEGGFLVPARAFVDDVAKTCKEHGILLIADEVQTGFARTGRMFGCEHHGLEPDLMTLAKSISNGFPLSAVVGRADVMDKVHSGGIGGTFGGNPVACAAALGAIETIEQEGLVARAAKIGDTVAKRFAAFVEKFPHVGETRGLGAMRAIEIVKDKSSLEPDKTRAEKTIDLAARRGLLTLGAGLYGNVIRTLMPLVITDAELDEALSVLESCLAEVKS